MPKADLVDGGNGTFTEVNDADPIGDVSAPAPPGANSAIRETTSARC